MRVLITGATGFIGRHLAWRLASLGDDITCLVRPTSDRAALAELGVRFLEGDVTRPETFAAQVAGFDAVYHLAGCLSALDRDRLQAVNEAGVGHVADACAACPRPPILLVVSSLAAAGPGRRRQPRVEGDPPAPVSAYGRSKLAGEVAARARAGRVPTTILRPPIVYGEGDAATFELFRLARRGVHLTPTLRSRTFSTIHVADLAHVMVRVVESGERLPPPDQAGSPGQGVYFAADKEVVTFAELGRRLGRAVHRPVRVIPLPSPLTWAAAAASEAWARLRGTTPELSLDKAREATAGSWACSGAKARDGLRIKLRTSMDERLAQTARWYQDQGWFDR
ncbi:MAG: NAD(P)-dependent oxidoreductase [Myxococcales bacterium]|nr:NAD(P)-dependent oxidoreductase [Myxococcales bacterium]